MRFCQADGTPLEDEAPAFDPYATIVGFPSEVSKPDTAPEPAEEPVAAVPEDAPPIAEPEEVLDLPEADPLKTMFVSETELQAVLAGDAGSAKTADAESEASLPPVDPLPPLDEPQPQEAAVPELPSFSVPDVPAPSFGDLGAPPSPFSASDSEPAASRPTFEEPLPAAPSFEEVPTMMTQPPPVADPVAEWAPPPAPEPSWQDQQIGSNTPFQPPPAGAAGQNKTLAIISLVCGILSLVCCSWFVPGITAVILGVVARGKAKSSPAEYGGEGLALGGMITGGISVLLGVVFWILYVLGFMAGMLGNLG